MCEYVKLNMFITEQSETLWKYLKSEENIIKAI